MTKRYREPPVIEVVCEFRFDPGSEWDLAVPGLIYEKVSDGFPLRRQTRTFETSLGSTMEGGQQQVIQVTQTDQLRFLREDEKAFIQISPNVLAVNHLKPYPTWEGFLPLITKGLAAYREVANPTGFKRIGLRYINQFDLPGSRAQLESYVDFYPFVGQQLPQAFAAFNVRIDTPFEGERDILRLQFTNVRPAKSDVVTLRLDLDYFLGRPGDVPLGSEYQWLEQAHSHIEATFEGCLKESLRQQFGEVRE